MIELIKSSDKKTKNIKIDSYIDLIRAINDKVKPYELYIGKITNLHGCFSRLYVIYDCNIPDDYFHGLEEWDVEHITNMSYLFSNLNCLESAKNITINIESWYPKSLECYDNILKNSNNFLNRNNNDIICSELFAEKILRKEN